MVINDHHLPVQKLGDYLYMTSRLILTENQNMNSAKRWCQKMSVMSKN